MAKQPALYNSCYGKAVEQQQESGTFRRIPAALQAGWVDFTSNDYLGLSNHPGVINAAKNALDKYGCGSTGSRLLSGNFSLCEDAEQQFAAHFGCEQALLFNSGFQANSTILPALLSRKTLGEAPLVFSDRLIHASLQQGLQLASATNREKLEHYRFQHNDVQQLFHLLEKHHTPGRPTFIVTESLFSMDGDYAPLMQLITLKKQYNAFLHLDIAHSIGLEVKPNLKDVDLVLGTFGKALGSCGAVLGGNEALIQYLVNTCKGLIYSTALPPASVAGAMAALEIATQEPERATNLAKMTSWFRKEIQSLGFDTGNSTSHIIPVVMGPPEAAKKAAKVMAQHQIRCLPINPPTVPKGTSRLRFILRADHTRVELEKALIALQEIAYGNS